jgi:PUA domain protein
MQVKSRHHLRSDEVARIRDAIEAALGVRIEGDSFERVEFDSAETDLVLVDGEPLVAYFDGEPFLTVRGANAFPPERRTVTVDAGAVSFVSDGADVMRPGIVEADDVIEPDELVVIVEETHGKALAVGRSRVAGDELVGDAGKVVDSVHHVGDELYQQTV